MTKQYITGKEIKARASHDERLEHAVREIQRPLREIGARLLAQVKEFYTIK